MTKRKTKRCPECYGHGVEIDAIGIPGVRVDGFREYTCPRCAGTGRVAK